jgi:hypothetical protein
VGRGVAGSGPTVNSYVTDMQALLRS